MVVKLFFRVVAKLAVALDNIRVNWFLFRRKKDMRVVVAKEYGFGPDLLVDPSVRRIYVAFKFYMLSWPKFTRIVCVLFILPIYKL